MLNYLLNDPLGMAITAGISVSILVGVWRYFFKPKERDISFTSKQSNDQRVTINNFPSEKIMPESSEDHNARIDFKARTKILFVEDETFKQIKNLKKAGWQVTQVVDISSLDIPEVRDAHIIFVDYKGVGKLSGDQGRGLVKSLKNEYGSKKWIIFYSAHPFTLDIHNIGADSFLAKDSDFYEIEQKIMEGARKILV